MDPGQELFHVARVRPSCDRDHADAIDAWVKIRLRGPEKSEICGGRRKKVRALVTGPPT